MSDGLYYVVTKQMKTINVGGLDIDITKEQPEVAGFMVMFYEYDKALEFASGDADCVKPCKKSK